MPRTSNIHITKHTHDHIRIETPHGWITITAHPNATTINTYANHPHTVQANQTPDEYDSATTTIGPNPPRKDTR